MKFLRNKFINRGDGLWGMGKRKRMLKKLKKISVIILTYFILNILFYFENYTKQGYETLCLSKEDTDF